MQAQLDEELLEARADEVRALRLENATRLRRAEDMAAASSQGAASSGDAGEPTFSKAVRDLALQYRGVPRRLINEIYTASFKPQSLVRLRSGIQVLGTDDLTGKVASGVLVWTPKEPTSKVFNDDILIFLECVAVYIEIYDGLHGVSHPSARRAMNKFSTFLLHKGQIYQAHTCISMGLTLLLDALEEPHNPDAWSTESHQWDQRFFHLDNIKMSAPAPRASKRPRLDETAAAVCRNYNLGKCNYRNCRWAHQCTECAGDHPAKDHPPVKKEK